MLADCGYVVVVDDAPSLRQMVIKYLEDNNVPTKSASNGTQFNRHFAGTPDHMLTKVESSRIVATDCSSGPVRAVRRGGGSGWCLRNRGVEGGGYKVGGWRLDRRSRRPIDPQERPIALSKGEYALLLAFLDAPERPLSREYLLQATRLHEDIFDRSIDVQVLRLRRKLEADPKAPRVIRTERGVGYVFAIPVEQSRWADWRSIPQNR